MAADLLAVLAMDPEQATAIAALGALPLLSALLNLQHSPGVCSLLYVHLISCCMWPNIKNLCESATASPAALQRPASKITLLSLQLKSACAAAV